jgi:hypothetical protein
MSNENLPAVGDRIIVNDSELPARFMGMEARVVSVDNSDLPLYVDFEIADAHSYWIRRGMWTVPTTLADVMSEDLSVTVKDLQDEVERWKRLHEEAATRLTEQQRRYSHDLSWIDRYFRETLKSEQSWCDDGYNEVVRKVNDNMEGGYVFEEIEELEEVEVEVEGTVNATVKVWVTKGDDAEDSDNWKDSDGDEIGDPEETMKDALAREYRSNGFDSVEVS